MAVRTIPSPMIEILDATGELIVNPSGVSDASPDGNSEVNLGAFRGLAFALIFQVVLFLLGGVAWQIFRALR
jgi:hypothetical protein